MFMLLLLFILPYYCMAFQYLEPDLPLAPDKRIVAKIGQAVWENKVKFLKEAEKEEEFPEECLDIIWDLISEEEYIAPDDLAISCLQCRTLLSALRGFQNQGLQFEDIRDFAVDVCYNVTPSLGWDGDIMCEGMIDVFGPHVYWVLNQTNLDPREICEFHFTCPVEEAIRNKNKKVQNERKFQKTFDKIPERPKSKKQIMKVVHLTDVHLDEKYAPGSPSECEGLPLCCRDNFPGSGEAGEWGEYGCALSIPTLHVILRFIAEQDVDLIINTGDTPNHALWEESQEGQLRQSEILADGIREFIPGVPAHLNLGNHDTYPTNQFYGPSPYIKDLLINLRTMYQDLANFTDDNIQTFEEAGYYTKLLIPGLRLMAYNSEYGYTDNYYGVLLEESPDWSNMVQFMEDTFDYARANGEKILLISHHPMGGGFTFWHDFITNIMDRNGDLVILHLFGHTHSDDFKMGLDENGNAFHVNVITSALTSQRNPAFKIFYVDTNTMMPVEFETYFLNLTKPVADGEEPVIELMYSSTTDYNMPDLSPASFQNFTDRMEIDDDLFYQYRWNENSRYAPPGECIDSCKKSTLCRCRSVSREGYDECMTAL